MKTLYFKIICLAGMLFCCWVTVANDYLKTGYSYRKYSVNDGLPESMVWSLFQDDKGFIWMGTYNGFVRYDGAAFKTYLSDKDYNVLRVTESVSGNIHALLFRQIYTTLPNDSLKLKKIEKWRLCPYTGRSMPAGYVFYEDTGNKEKALFAVTDTGLVKTWGHNILNNMEQYRKPYWDRNAKLFYVPTAKGVYLIAEDGIVRDSIPVTTIHCIVPHQNGLWAVGSDGIFKYVDGGLHKEYGHTFHFDPTVGINAIPGDDGKLFIQSYTKIDRFDNGQLETVAEETIIYDMLIDREKNLWIATYNGVYNFFRLNFKDYILMHGEDVVRSIISDDKGGILAATMENLLIHISGNAYELIPHPRIPDVSFFQGKPGVTDRKYYFPGMYQTGDVMRYHDGKSNWLNLPASMYHYVEVLPGGNLLVGGYTRMLICNPDGGVIRELDVAKLKQQPACAYADKQGRIWIGGAAGISIVDGDSIYSKFDNNYAPAQNMVADKNGNIWFSAQNRLYSISGDSIRLMHTFSGTTVRGVLFTRNNTLIVSILQGICVLSPGSSGFLYYDKYNGFMGEKLIRGTPVEDNDGYVWVISQNGLVRFRPDDLIYKQPAPVLHLQIVQSSTDNIHWATER